MVHVIKYLQLRPIPGPNMDAAADAATDAAERWFKWSCELRAKKCCSIFTMLVWEQFFHNIYFNHQYIAVKGYQTFLPVAAEEIAAPIDCKPVQSDTPPVPETLPVLYADLIAAALWYLQLENNNRWIWFLFLGLIYQYL